MNKGILLVLITLFFNNSHSSTHGRLFEVNANMENQLQLVELCLLNANNQADCEQFYVYGSELRIRSRKPVESSYYLNAGLKAWKTNTYIGCTMMPNQYCAFSVTHNQWSYIKLS